MVKTTKDFLNNQDNIDMIIKEIDKLSKQDSKNDFINSLKKQLEIYKKKKNNLLEALANCDDKNLRPDIYSKLTEINNNIEGLENELSNLEPPYR